MTREKKQKAIDALKISAPIMAVTQEEFTDYIQTLNKIMDWLEQEPCDDAISRQYLRKQFQEKCVGECSCCEWDSPYWCGLIDNAPSVNPQEREVLDKIRAEIEQAADKQFQIAMGIADLNERYTHIQMENAYRHSSNIIDKYTAEVEPQESEEV